MRDALVRSVILKRDDIDANVSEVFELTRSFLQDRSQFLRHLFEDDA